MTEQDYRRLFERIEPAPALVERTLSAAGARPGGGIRCGGRRPS